MSSDSAHADALTIGVAGAGIFAQKAHRPAIEKSRFAPTAVYSRRADNAKQFAQMFASGDLKAFDDVDAFLASERFDAVDIVVPPQGVGDIIRQSLAAGKHVLSEKPVAATVAQATELIDWWKAMPAPPVWLVSENWRLEPAFARAKELIEAGQIGEPVQIWCECIVFRPPDSPYESGWRVDGAERAAWLTDIGPHALAALRQISGDIQTYENVDYSRSGEHESVMANLRFINGLPGYLSLARAIGPQVANAFDIVVNVLGTRGRLRADRTRVNAQSLSSEPIHDESFSYYSVNGAIDLFADTIASHNAGKGGLISPENPLHPDAALKDLATIETIQRML